MFNFIKMHGVGNDFAIFDEREGKISFSSQVIKKMSNRNKGIGFDQLIILSNSDRADIKMSIYNADGSAAGNCGNAARCVADLTGRDSGAIEVGDRLLFFKKQPRLNNEPHYTVNMGKPEFAWDKIPLSSPVDPLNLNFEIEGFKQGAALSMGNPHLVFFSSIPLELESVAKYGALFENHELFPQAVNVNFAHILDNNHIALTVYERGAGITLACGSGACATAVIAYTKKLINNKCKVDLPGGTLLIEITKDLEVLMTGSAVKCFEGQISF